MLYFYEDTLKCILSHITIMLSVKTYAQKHIFTTEVWGLDSKHFFFLSLGGVKGPKDM